MKPTWASLLLAVGMAFLLLTIIPTTSSAAYRGANGLIAYTESTPYAEQPGDRDADIFTVSPRGGPPTQLTNNSVDDFQPTWSPNGRRIAFARWDAAGGDWEVWTIRGDGTDQARVTRTRANETHPYFSPNGGRIIVAKSFHRHRPGGNIVSLRADGSDPVRLVNSGQRSYEPTFSPDGRRIAFSGAARKTGTESGVWIMHRDGSHLRLLARNHSQGSRSISYEDPDFSPDGSRVAYVRFIVDVYDRTSSKYDVMVSDTRTRSSSRPFASLDHGPAFSPDGTRLAGVRTSHYPLPFPDPAASRIVSVARGGGDAQDVTQAPEGTFDGSPSWQPIPQVLSAP
jgi:Tol biopolymer transport system component